MGGREEGQSAFDERERGKPKGDNLVVKSFVSSSEGKSKCTWHINMTSTKTKFKTIFVSGLISFPLP